MTSMTTLKTWTRRHAAATLAAAAATLCAGQALAQDNYPAKTIRVIVPYAPGGLPDSVLRRVAPLMEKELGQTLVVDGGNVIQEVKAS